MIRAKSTNARYDNHNNTLTVVTVFLFVQESLRIEVSTKICPEVVVCDDGKPPFILPGACCPECGKPALNNMNGTNCEIFFPHFSLPFAVLSNEPWPGGGFVG